MDSIDLTRLVDKIRILLPNAKVQLVQNHFGIALDPRNPVTLLVSWVDSRGAERNFEYRGLHGLHPNCTKYIFMALAETLYASA